MAAFVRRYSSEPTEAELLKIEGVVVIDGAPAPGVRGTGTGTVLCVCETEDGPFCADAGPVEVLGDPDRAKVFGGFGFTYDGQPGQHPCCRSRKADGAMTPEFWNGSGFVQLKGGRFARLFIGRVDASVGSVTLSRLASISGLTSPSWDLEPGWTLKLKVDGAGAVAVTWDAAVGTILSADGVYPSTFSGGEAISFKIDGVTYSGAFTSGDQSHVQVVARLNAIAGFTAFVASTLKTRINGVVRGTSGSVQIVSLDALVATATGFSAGSAVPGTGDVANIDLVTDAEVTSRVEADAPGASFDRDANGAGRAFSTTALTGTVEVDSTGTATAAFGFEADVQHTAAAGVAGVVPAGTRVQASGSGQLFVTVQAVQVTAASAGPYAVKVRHAEDDQTGLAEIADAVDTLYAPLQAGAFAVANPLPVTAALTDAQLDARYVAAIAKTRGVSSPARQINLSFSARQSNAVRAAVKQNALDASAHGCFGRVAFIRPPLGTLRSVARGSTQPGVGAYRDQDAVYCYPGVQKFVAEVAAVGLSGGVGFTADGVVNAGFDMAMASLCSSLPPEENVGQETSILDWVLGVESGNADVADLQEEDYTAFKAAGIAAPRVDEGVSVQSAVTSVDPALFPALAPLRRRRFSFFYQDSVAQFLRPWVKRLAIRENRALAMSRLTAFLRGLGERVVQEQSAVYGDAKVAGNTPESLARDVYRTKHFVRMVSSMDVIVVDTSVGNDVTITAN